MFQYWTFYKSKGIHKLGYLYTLNQIKANQCKSKWCTIRYVTKFFNYRLSKVIDRNSKLHCKYCECYNVVYANKFILIKSYNKYVL